ncbi:MAG TPA: class I SAM-dependent methyltransferase [Acidimicrobiales bacterium]|nr:class I SAM-dependent methyltransferase [Acidimicrobiales bacterium]
MVEKWGVSGHQFGSLADDYALHRADFPVAGIERLVALGIGISGQRLLDLGCGTGTLARQFASRGCTVTGVDIDVRMLAAARDLAAEADLQIEWLECHAEETGFSPGSFDVITAAQCWHWFDGEAAASEVRRLLLAGGLVAVCGFDWLPLPDTVSGVTEALIETHNPSWELGGIRDPGPSVRRQLEDAGLEVLETFTFDIDVPYAVESWHRRIGASAAILDLSAEAAAAFDAQLRKVLTEQFPGDYLIAPHRVWASVARSPG